MFSLSLDYVAELAARTNFVGRISDSRSFLAFCHHLLRSNLLGACGISELSELSRALNRIIYLWVLLERVYRIGREISDRLDEKDQGIFSTEASKVIGLSFRPQTRTSV